MKLKNLILFATICLGFEYAQAQLKFNDPRIFAPLKGSNATAGYVIVKNEGKKDVTLVLKSVEKFKAVETHETVEESGKMSMKKVESFVVPAGKELELKPGGRHLMLFDPTAEVTEGQMLKVVFTANNKNTEVKFKVISRIPKTESVSEHTH